MLLTRKLNLVAFAVVVTMSWLGASTARAEYSTALCSVNEPELNCPVQNRVSQVHFVDPEATFLGAFNIACEALFSGEIEGSTLAALSNPLAIGGQFTYSNCSFNCKITDLTGGDLLILKTKPNLGSVAADDFEIRVVCPGLIQCTYITNGLVGHALSAELPAHAGLVTLDKQVIHHLPAGIMDVCFVSAELDVLFESLNPLYLKS